MENITLRIMIACNLRSIWYEPDPSAVGIAWHGEEAWRMSELQSTIGLDYKVVTGKHSEHIPISPPLSCSNDKLLHTSLAFLVRDDQGAPCLGHNETRSKQEQIMLSTKTKE